MPETIPTFTSYEPWRPRWSYAKLGALALLFSAATACGKAEQAPNPKSISIDCQQQPGKSVSLKMDTTKTEQQDIGDGITENGKQKWRDVFTVYTKGDRTVSPVADGFGPIIPYAQIEAASQGEGVVGPITDSETGSRLDMNLVYPPDGKTIVLKFTCGPG